jgi:hypothetical protein
VSRALPHGELYGALGSLMLIYLVVFRSPYRDIFYTIILQVIMRKLKLIVFLFL